MNRASTLQSILDSSIPALLKISPQVLSQKPSPDKWSKKEILGHLIDSAINNHRRFKQCLHQDHLVFDGYDQDNEVLINDYQNRPSSDIIKLWEGMNQQLIQIIKAIPEQKMTHKSAQHNYHRICFNRIPENQESTIKYLISDYIDHLEHHLAQIIPDVTSLSN